MSAPAALPATFCGFRSVGSRKVVALTFEVPVEYSERALKMLGHPDAVNPKWFAIALLDEKAAAQVQGAVAPALPKSTPPLVNTREKRNWNELPPATQAGIRCGEPAFHKFLYEANPPLWEEVSKTYEPADAAAAVVRRICGVSSRSQLSAGEGLAAWQKLNDRYEVWMRT
jgi:hypothetical protein